LPRFGADGDFGGEMQEWVGKFQTGHDLDPSGTIDGVTASMLDNYGTGSG
jgi:hypothetical protein